MLHSLGEPCSLITTEPLPSLALELCAELPRDLDADAESESAARRGVFLGGESDRVSSPLPSAAELNEENALEDGRVSKVCTSIAIVYSSSGDDTGRRGRLR